MSKRQGGSLEIDSREGRSRRVIVRLPLMVSSMDGAQFDGRVAMRSSS